MPHLANSLDCALYKDEPRKNKVASVEIFRRSRSGFVSEYHKRRAGYLLLSSGGTALLESIAGKLVH